MAGFANWEEDFQRKLTTPEEAVKLVKSGDVVALPIFPPQTLPPALAARAGELRDVMIRALAPAGDPGWFSPGMEESFQVEFETYIGDFARAVHQERRGTFLPSTFSRGFKHYEERPEVAGQPDVAMVVISRPNRQGFVHFGPHNWTKRQYVRSARVAIGEIDDSLIPVHGDCYVHISEFDALVEFTPPEMTPEQLEEVIADLPPDRQEGWRDLYPKVSPQFLASMAGVIKAVSPGDAAAMLGLVDPPPEYHAIAGYLREFIHDGDCIQIGTGEPARFIPGLGVFDERQELGLHTELGSPGYGRLVRDGIITNSQKAIHRGKCVAAAWTGVGEEDLEIIADNPLFTLHDPSYVLDLHTLTQLENYVAINNGVSVDFTGQIKAETAFGQFNMLNGLGGQPEAHLGAFFSRGGRAITLLPSTAIGGSVSRIVPMLEEGSFVTVPRFFADIIITEHGVAQLLGKNHRQRAEELINVAHPDFRADLRKEFERLL